MKLPDNSKSHFNTDEYKANGSFVSTTAMFWGVILVLLMLAGCSPAPDPVDEFIYMCDLEGGTVTKSLTPRGKLMVHCNGKI